MSSTEREILERMDAEAKAEAQAYELERRIAVLPPEKAAELTRRVAAADRWKMILARVASLVLMAVFWGLYWALDWLNEGYAGLDAEYPHPLVLMNAAFLTGICLLAVGFGQAWLYKLPPKSGSQP